jgi:hypothetical protein
MTRWAFGDWRYYARGRSGPYESVAAVLWPTRGALGRQAIGAAPAQLDDLIAQLGIGIDEAFPLLVERAAVAALRQRLESLFEANRATLLYNPSPRLEFVHHPEPYTLFNSSNRKVAQWLRELGCEISGVPLLSNWRVETNREPGNAPLATEHSSREALWSARGRSRRFHTTNESQDAEAFRGSCLR